MDFYCSSYCGAACVDGSCPIALREEYEDRGIDVPLSCGQCWLYRGCEDCAFDGTDMCDKKKP